ncbi:MAG: hypothetical protein ABR600_06795 [Actinomycetota bacterium]
MHSPIGTARRVSIDALVNRERGRHRFRVATAAIAAAVVAGAVVGTALSLRREASTPISPVSPSPVLPSPAPTLPSDVSIGSLSTQGIAIGVAEGVRLIAPDGHVERMLSGYSLWGPRFGPVVVLRRKDRALFELDADSGRLIGLPSRAAARNLVRPMDLDHLPPATGSPTFKGEPTGSWLWAEMSPNGSTVLAEWRDECDFHSAWFISTSGGPPRTVIGGGYARAPISFPLGWTPTNEAVVQLEEAFDCGGVGHRAGLYAVDPRGALTLISPAIGPAAMWGSAGRPVGRG